MSRGIMKHGPIKTFLTRGIVGRIFRPILYTKIDKINYEFVQVLTETMEEIDRKIHSPNKMALQIWFSIAPLEHFELLFLPNKKNRTIIPMLEKAEINNGKECAYLTQGFMLFNFQQLLKNSPEYREQIKTSVEDVDNTCISIFGENNKVLKYLNYFRITFKIDPLDQPIIYVYKATELFIPDPNRKQAAIKDWDNDIIGKLSFINGFTEFIINQKKTSLIMMN